MIKDIEITEGEKYRQKFYLEDAYRILDWMKRKRNWRLWIQDRKLQDIMERMISVSNTHEDDI
jgi:hypothetical protein